MTTPDIAGVIAELWDCADWSRPKQCKKISKAADTLERQAAEIERLREGLNGAKHELRLVIRDIDAALTGEGQ
jgi:hypothetical protein